jgi:hypothetical protein
VTHTPPSPAASGGYPPRTVRDDMRLPSYSGSERGHRSARQPGPLRRLFGRRRADEDDAVLDSDGPPAAVPTYRAQHRGPGPAPRPGPRLDPPRADARPDGRTDADHAAREHLAAFRPEPPAAPADPGALADPATPAAPAPLALPAGPAAGPGAAGPGAGPGATGPTPPARFIPNPSPTPVSTDGDDQGEDQRDLLYQVLGGLALRDLTLVESLLQVVEKLESNEDDAGQLELLFRIDHLATRMRRNSENLLVLAGHDNHSGDLEPIPLLDVARAAISEITDYSRAQIASLPDIRIAGVAADDLSHILAELLENATSKSPESATVVIRAEKTGDGTMVISVEDSGIGIPADQLAAINTRLGRAPVVEPSVTRRMGLYVVGRLAQRHGIRVQLRERPYGGITAHVITPSRLIQAGPEAPPRVARRPPAQPAARPGNRSRPAPPAAAAPAEPPRPATPPAPRFAPADPSTLPRRSPGQRTSEAPPPAHASPPVEPAGARADRIRGDLADFRLGQSEARAATPEVHHSNGLPRREPGQNLGQDPAGGTPGPEAGPA